MTRPMHQWGSQEIAEHHALPRFANLRNGGLVREHRPRPGSGIVLGALCSLAFFVGAALAVWTFTASGEYMPKPGEDVCTQEGC